MSDNESRILAIDPGEKTGIAYIVNGEFVWGMVAAEEAFSQEIFIRSLTTMTRPTTIILETPPSKTPHSNEAQTKIFHLLKNLYKVAGFHVLDIPPGLWKGLIERSKIDAAHIRDATDIGKLQYTRELKKQNV